MKKFFSFKRRDKFIIAFLMFLIGGVAINYLVSGGYEKMLLTAVSSIEPTFDHNYPAYGKYTGTETSASDIVIENSYTRVTFRQREISNRGNIIQNKVELLVDGTYKTVKNYNEGYGYLVLYADSASPLTDAENPTFTFNYNGVGYKTDDSYKAGYPTWILPSEMERKDQKTVVLTGENDYSSVTVTWSLNDNDKEPKVDVSFKAKKEGNYSYGMFYTQNALSVEDTKFIQVPFRYQEKSFPHKVVRDGSGNIIDYVWTPYMVTEAYSTSGITQVTSNTGNKISNKDLTYGLVVDPSCQHYRWVYNEVLYLNGLKVQTDFEQSNYGLTITTTDKKVNPGIFAPVMGSSDSKMSKNEEYTFSYRPTTNISNSSVDSWYENYSDVLTRVLKVNDYRSNYYASLTDTIFNVQDLLMNDKASGWSKEGKAHYYHEVRNIVSNYDPMAYLQLYLLTEDDDIYKRRTLPTIESTLSRTAKNFAFAGPLNKGISGTASYDASVSDSNTILDGRYSNTPEGYAGLGLEYGKMALDYPTSTYASLYYMTMGRTPIFGKIATENFRSSYVARQNEDSAIRNASEYLAQYNITGNSSTYQTAINKANLYIDKVINSPNVTPIPSNEFVNQKYYPHFYSMLDMYEATGDKKYLTAAESAAKRLITTLWSTKMPSAGNQALNIDEINARILYDPLSVGFYKGDRRARLGVNETWTGSAWVASSILNGHVGETNFSVPAWVPSRIGLGLEAASTFKGSSNIQLSTWAPELMRLYAYTGNELYYIYARNGIIGRYASYPGYYLQEFQTYSSMENYAINGADGTGIEFHHIPITLSMLQDFLFEQAFALSNKNISFPTTKLQGAAWFNIRHYGFQSGKVFDENNMWLWLKDGRVSFVYMNESSNSVTTTAKYDSKFQLGNSTKAILYTMNANGTYSKKEVNISNGSHQINVPAHGIVAVAFDAVVSEPNYATNKPEYTGVQHTVSRTNVLSDSGTCNSSGIYDATAYAVQLKKDVYNAYIYTARRPDKVSYEYNGKKQTMVIDSKCGINKIEVSYKVDGVSKTAIVDNTYPFEVSIEVPKNSTFEWKIKFYRSDGSSYEGEYQSLSSYKTQEELLTKTYTATFDKNGSSEIGSNSLSCSTKGNSCEIIAPSITREGYDILGWSTKSTSTTAEYTVGSKITLSSNIKLYAITKIKSNAKTYTVTFDKNGSSEIGSSSLSCSTTENSCEIIAPTITREGYDILGWSTKSTSTTAEYTVGSKITLSSDIKLYAITKKKVVIKTYTATFDVNGATIDINSLSCSTKGDSCTIIAPMIRRYDYNIIGWSFNNNANKAEYKVGEAITLTNNIKLYAITEKIIMTKRYNAVFVSPGANVETQSLSCTTTGNNCKVVAPTIIKKGHNFLGWGNASNSTNVLYKAGDNISINSNLTLYAITEPIQNVETILFGDLNSDNKISIIDVVLLNIYLKNGSTNNIELKNADYNNDKKITRDDLILLRKELVNRRNSNA